MKVDALYKVSGQISNSHFLISHILVGITMVSNSCLALTLIEFNVILYAVFFFPELRQNTWSYIKAQESKQPGRIRLHISSVLRGSMKGKSIHS